jgi:hypothetical protein
LGLVRWGNSLATTFLNRAIGEIPQRSGAPPAR